jgi:hypothetical protein
LAIGGWRALASSDSILVAAQLRFGEVPMVWRGELACERDMMDHLACAGHRSDSIGAHRRNTMKERVHWIVVGGVSFWLPAVLLMAAVQEKVTFFELDIVPLASLVLLAMASWLRTKRFPRWGWVLAGIYIFGPSAMLIPSAFGSSPASDLTGKIIGLAICLFPPMTLWLSLLNGMFVAVLVATMTLPFLADYQRVRALREARELASTIPSLVSA